MSIISHTFAITGQVGVAPRRIKFISTDNYETVTSAGYLNQFLNQVDITDVIDAVYDYDSVSLTGSHAEFLPLISSGVITLIPYVPSSFVDLPVVDGDIVEFNGTSGAIKDSGILSSTVSISDGTFQTDCLVVGSGTGTGLTTSGIKLTTGETAPETISGTTKTVTGTGTTSDTIVLATLLSSTNAVSIYKAVSSADSITFTFTGAPGANTSINYVMITPVI